MAYPTVSSALEMKFCLKVVSEKSGEVPKDVVHLGERGMVLQVERRKEKAEAELANTHCCHLRRSFCKEKDLLVLEST